MVAIAVATGGNSKFEKKPLKTGFSADKLLLTPAAIQNSKKEGVFGRQKGFFSRQIAVATGGNSKFEKKKGN